VAEVPENLTLAYLRRMDGKLDQVMTVLGVHGRRLTALEIAVANLAAAEASHYANTALRMDQMSDRIDRIERRLELAPGCRDHSVRLISSTVKHSM
jgi:hypothetical protein